MSTPTLERTIVRQLHVPNGDININGRPKISYDEYMRSFYEHPESNYEFNDGTLEEKPTMATFDQNELKDFVTYLLTAYRSIHPDVIIVWDEIGFTLDLADKRQVRKPDIGIILPTNAISPLGEERIFGGIYDVCMELVSDSTRAEADRDLIIKLAEYEEAGVQEYWILSDRATQLLMYRLVEGVYEQVGSGWDAVWESEVLEGFKLRPEHVLTPPKLEMLMVDEVYRGYVQVHYHAERDTRMHAEQLAEAEREAKLQEREARLHAEQAKLHAEQLAEAERLAKLQEREARLHAEQRAEAERQAKLHAEQAKLHAEQLAESERQARMHAEQRATQLAEMLKQLGINPD
jgi:Uma2 family endonuclease